MGSYKTDIFNAIVSGDTAEILDLFNRSDISFREMEYGKDKAFDYLIINGQWTEQQIIEILMIFLDPEIVPDYWSFNFQTVFNSAATYRMKGIIDFLIKHNYLNKCEPDDKSFFIRDFTRNEFKKFRKITSLDENCIKRDADIIETESISFVEYIISKGIDLDVLWEKVYLYINIYRYSILSYSISYDLLHILPILLKYSTVRCHITYDNRTLLHEIFHAKNENRKSSISVNWYADYRKRYVPTIVKNLLERGCSAVAADKKGLTPIRAAIESDEDVSIVEILTNYFPDGCDKNNLAMSLLCEIMIAKLSDSRIEYYRKILDDLVANVVDINGKNGSGDRPIQCAIRARNFVAVKYLKEKDVDFSVLTDNDDNLLHLLAEKTDGKDYCEKTDEMLFDYFMTEGCQLNRTNKAGNSPLHVAAQLGNLTIARKFIYHNVSVNCRNNKMQTPLHCAVESEESIHIIEFLIDAGAKINSKDIEGCTPLHIAASVSKSKSHTAILKVLLNRGACINLKDNNGDTAFVKVIRNESFEEAMMLLEYGPNINNSRVLNLAESQVSKRFFGRILGHWYRLKAVKLPCLEDYGKITGFSNATQFYEECLKEVEKLKSTFIDSYTSIYDFLHMDLDSRRIHIYNEKLLNYVNCPELNVEFPKYFILILASYREAVVRKDLIEPVVTVWLRLTGINLPDICIERILHYLDSDDLISIADEYTVVNQKLLED